MPMVNRANEPLFEEESKYAPFNPNQEEEKTGGLPLRPVRSAPPQAQQQAKENRRTREVEPKLASQKSGGDQMFQVNDEYDQVDELQCQDEHKVMVKKATRACNQLIKENSEMFRLSYRVQEMTQELDEMELFFGDMHTKILDRCALIKKIMENPMKLHKIKKNQI